MPLPQYSKVRRLYSCTVSHKYRLRDFCFSSVFLDFKNFGSLAQESNRLTACAENTANTVFLFMCAISFHAAKDLIRGLLKTDPRERYTVEQVINNPWIKVL